MKRFLIFSTLLLQCMLFSQTTLERRDYYGNSLEFKAERNDNNNIDIFITNLSNDNRIKRFEITASTTENEFVLLTKSIIDNIVTKYYFNLTKDVLFTTGKSINHDTIANAVKALPEEAYIKFIKSKLIYNINGQKYTDFINNIPDEGKYIFKVQKRFKVLESDNSKIVIDSVTSDTINLPETENGFVTEFYNKYKDNSEIIKQFLITEEEYKIFEITNIDKELSKFFEKATGADGYSFLRNIQAGSNIFEASIKPFNKEKYYILRFCNIDNCHNTIKINYATERDSFIKIVDNFFNSSFKIDADSIDSYEVKLLYDDCKKYNTQAITNEVASQFKDTISSLIKQIENMEPQYSGILKLNEKVRVYDRHIKNGSSFRNYIYKSVPATVRKNLDMYDYSYTSRKYDSNNNLYFIIKYATIRFFNNKAKEIVIVGHIDKPEKLSNVSEKIEFVTLNVNHSIPMRSLNNSNQYTSISPEDKDADSLFINYNDVFQYYPSESTYNYSVKNSDYRLNAGDSIKIEQRRLTDFFTAVIFSDFLGLNSENANALIQAEGRLKMPLWIYNEKKVSLFSALRADVNASLYNSFDDSSRHMTPLNSNDGVTTEALDILNINNFDYIKYNNVNAGIGIDAINLELKGLSTDISLGYGLRYYRAGAKYTIETPSEEDMIKTYQLNALSHEINMYAEIRPQLNFGADINLALNWLNGRGSVENIPINYTSNGTGADDKVVLKTLLNLYSKVNPKSSNDGIYARVGGYYHFKQNDFFPQILVGYATNLSSFVNSFKK